MRFPSLNNPFVGALATHVSKVGKLATHVGQAIAIGAVCVAFMFTFSGCETVHKTLDSMKKAVDVYQTLEQPVVDSVEIIRSDEPEDEKEEK